MADPRHLSNAPIVEALLRIKGRYSEASKPSFSKRVQAVLGPDYPKVEERTMWEHSFTVKDGTVRTNRPKKANKGPDAYRFIKTNGTQVVLVGADGFTFSRLKPYPGWDLFIEEARRIRSDLEAIASSGPCPGVELRFINLVQLPLPVMSLEDYLVAMPSLPNTVTGVVSGFLTKVDFQDSATSARVSFTQATQPSTNAQMATLIMDIGLSLDFSAPCDESAIWDTFNAFRAIKNKVFFESVTEMLLEMHK